MHHHILEVDGAFIPKYMQDRQIDLSKLSKLTGINCVTLRKISENVIPMRYMAFYKITKVLSIHYEFIIKDRDILLEYNEYLKDHEGEVFMTKAYYKMTSKRNDLLDREFKELLEEL